MRIVAAVALLAVLMVAGCGSSDGGQGQTTTSPNGASLAGAGGCGTRAPFVGSQRIRVDGRRVWLHVPPQAADGRIRVPLVLALHGVGGKGGFLEQQLGLAQVADRAGFVAAYPYASGSPSAWRLKGDADVKFIRQVVDQLNARLCVDLRRLSLIGHSNGASFVLELGCRLHRPLHGIVADAPGADSPAPDSPAPDSPAPCSTPLLEIHGTKDPTVPYQRPYPSVLERARRAEGCDPTPRTVQERPGTQRLRWTGCRQPVEHLRVIGGGHQPPPGAGAWGWAFLSAGGP